MPTPTPAADALAQVAALIDSAEATDARGQRLRERSWTPANQRRFLELVADGNPVETAAYMVGLSAQSAYAFRRTARGQAFHLGWRAAGLLARDAIADRLMERAIKGQVETVVRPDGSTIERLRYDNRLATTLLRRLDRQAEEASDADSAAARMVAGEFDAYLGLVEADGGPARAGLFLARRSDLAGEDARDLQPILALAAADRFARTGAPTAAEVDIADLDPAQRGDWNGEQWARAEAAGLVAVAPAPPPAPAPAPQPPQPAQASDDGGEDQPRVWWCDFADDWRTDLAPPEDFDGEEEGDYGEEGYERALDPAEQAVWDAPHRRALAERLATGLVERAAFFAAAAEESGEASSMAS